MKSTIGVSTSAAHLADDLQRTAQRHPGRERAFRGALDHRSIGQWIRERHADFEDIRAGARDGLEQRGRALGVGIPGRQVGDEAAATCRPDSFKRTDDARTHVALPLPALST